MKHDLLPSWKDQGTDNNGGTLTNAPQHYALIRGRGTHARRVSHEEVVDFLEEHPTIIPLFEIDDISAVGTSPDEELITEALS